MLTLIQDLLEDFGSKSLSLRLATGVLYHLSEWATLVSGLIQA
jgi:hypothetical protein